MPQPDSDASLVYAGFWIRVWASIIDSVLVMVVFFPLAGLIPGVTTHTASGRLFTPYGRVNYDALGMSLPGPMHVLVFWVLPAIAVILFWAARSATPGKMAIGARIVDARSGVKPSTGQWIGRYFGYFVSTFPFLLGLIWVGFDPRKQGWHDKLAHTVVVRRRHNTQSVHFEGDTQRDGHP